MLALAWAIGGAAWAGNSDLVKAQPQGSEEKGAANKDAPLAKDHNGDPLPRGAVARLGTVRFRHEGGTDSLAFTPDGKNLVAYTESAVFVWDANTGKERYRLHVLPGSGEASGMGVSPDGTTLAIPEYSHGDIQTKVSLWNLHTGKKMRTLVLPKGEGKGARLKHLCFAPDGKSLALTSTGAGTAIVFDLSSGQVSASLGDDFRFYNLAFSPDNKTLAVAALPNIGVQLWDSAMQKLIRVIYVPAMSPKSLVRAMAFSPDGKMLACGIMDRILLFDPATAKSLGQFDAKAGQIIGLAFSPDGKTLISGSESDGKIRVWELATGKNLKTMGGGVNSRSLAVAPDGKTVALGTHGQFVQLWDVATGKELFAEDQGHDSAIKTLAFSPDGKVLASAGYSGPIFLWHMAPSPQPLSPEGRGPGVSGARSQRTISPAGNSLTFSFSPDGKQLAIGAGFHDDFNVQVRDMARGKDRLVVKVTSVLFIQSITYSPDGRKLFSLAWNSAGRKEYSVSHWDVVTSRRDNLWTLSQKDEPVLAPDGRTVFAALGDERPRGDHGAISIFDLRSGRERLLLAQIGERVYSLAASLDGRVLAAAMVGSNPGVRLWEVVTGKEILFLNEQPGSADVIAWSPDGRFLASGNLLGNPKEPTVRLWDAATGQEMAHFGGLQTDLTALAFSPDRTFLAAGLRDGTILILDTANAAHKAASPPRIGEGELEARWTDLIGDHAGKAHQAIGALVSSPKESVPFLKGRLKPVAVAYPDKVQQWIVDLDSANFGVRQSAVKELEKVGAQVIPRLQKALKDNPTLEARRRLEGILKYLPDVPGPDTVRTIRGIMALERIGSPEAQAVLEGLARGAPGARETEEAKASLERLSQRATRIPNTREK